MDTPIPLTPLTILVVEDNPTDIATVQWVLTAHALIYNLQVIENADHALYFLTSSPSPSTRDVPIYSCSISTSPSAMARNSCTISRPSPRVPTCAS